jgi:hypothetical protein
MVDAPVPDTGSAAEDFRLTLRGIMSFYTSPLGAIYAQLVGESQFYPVERERIRTHQVNVRRAAVRKIWDRGVARGELDPKVDPRDRVGSDLRGGDVPEGDRTRRIDAGRRRRHRGHSDAGTGQLISGAGPTRRHRSECERLECCYTQRVNASPRNCPNRANASPDKMAV